MVDKQSRRICRHYHVYGRVQGVWYRGSTRDRASELGLSGWVRNREDGSVESVACGSPASIEAFEVWLREGPPAARVDSVEISESTEEPRDGEFHVTR